MKAISVHLTDQCNNSCIFCVVNSYKEKREGVNKKVLYKFLEENSSKGYECVNIHGGEATILEDLEDILIKIRELGYKEISLQTNGRKLANYQYAKRLYECGVKLFVISLHGKDYKEHDYVTQEEGSFNEALKGIQNVKSLGAKVRTNTVVYKGNIDSLVSIAKLAIKNDVDHINISALHPAGKAYQNFKKVTPRYTDIMPEVFRTIDECVARKRVVTLEGFPVCIVKGYEKYQIQWDDIHYKLLFHNFIINDYADFMENETKEHGQVCKTCDHNNLCGGVYKEYLEFYGWDEFYFATPYIG